MVDAREYSPPLLVSFSPKATKGHLRNLEKRESLQKNNSNKK